MDQVLIGWLAARQLYNEPELNYLHGSAACQLADDCLNAIERANEHDAEQSEQSSSRTLPPVERKKLKCILSVHVDDLKGAATREIADSLLQHLNKAVGLCKAG